MGTGTTRPAEAALERFAGDWRLGLASGLVGGVAFGGLVSVTEPRLLRVMIPALYGLAPPPDAVLGWIVHLMHSSVLGIAFAAAIEHGGLAGSSAREQIGAGIAFALAVWFVLAVLVMPAWLSTMDSVVTVPFPYVSTAMLAGHVAYGLGAGVVYFAFDAAAEETTDDTSTGS